jgi:predicted unusual protein kinase regulating ubiquinone biosynthesis (AarF/ABC1/UbiB family)
MILYNDDDSLLSRLKRYGSVATSAGSFAATYALTSFQEKNEEERARALVELLGNLKGPLIKVAQLLATIPDLLPPAYMERLQMLQASAPPMGKLFVKRRMRGELGDAWEKNFLSFETEAFAAASLGQVHKAVSLEGVSLAVKLQYPDMEGTVEADLAQLRLFFSFLEKTKGGLQHDLILKEIVDHLREELDYQHEASNLTAFGGIYQSMPFVTIPKPIEALTTKRLLTMTRVCGLPLTACFEWDDARRNALARHLFLAWYTPLCQYGLLHGDSHMGNYHATEEGHIILYDFGCVRRFHAAFVEGIRTLYGALRNNDREALIHAYTLWGFEDLSNELIDILTLWATYLYEPLLDDRVRPIDENFNSQRGQAVAKEIFKALQQTKGLRPPREFVFIDRAAIGLGSVFMRLRATLNWHQLFEQILSGGILL